VRKADDRFHPRFDAISRHYRYRLYCRPIRNPLLDRYSWRIWPAPDEELLHASAAMLTGRHDFAAFGSPPRANGSTLRTVTLSMWTARGDEWIYDVVADAFLYRMVRRLVFVQVAVGQGKIQAEVFSQALENQEQLAAGLASPAGLTLVEVKYPIGDQ
jgi:tRNA pseudouridine38-40 synthase